MKRILLATIVIGTLVGGAQADDRFYGGFIVKAQSGECDFNLVDNRGTALLRPKSPENDSAKLSLWQSNEFVQAFERENGNFPVGAGEPTLKVSTMAVSGGGFGKIDNPVFVKFNKQTDLSKNFVDIVAKIKGYEFQPDCTVTVHISLIKRPVP